MNNPSISLTYVTIAKAVTSEDVNDYYSKVLTKSSDLKTNCCTTSGAPPAYLQRAMSNIHQDVNNKYYGCGFVAPDLLPGMRVLDLGCGAGRDVYLLAQLVGESGHVVGVDMSDTQLETARSTMEWHQKRFGYARSNVSFVKGYLETLLDGETETSKLLQENSFDVIVSNCVLNLSPDKGTVLANAYRLLKPGKIIVVVVSNSLLCIITILALTVLGGELYFSDVYSIQRVPQCLRQDTELWGECLSGALYWNDFMRLSRDSGFGDARLVTSVPVSVGNAALEERIAQHMPLTNLGPRGEKVAQFYSATYRLWKIAELEPDCENYGQAVRYLGTMPFPAVQNTTEATTEKLMSSVTLDNHHHFPAGMVVAVCGNTYRMLHQTRFRPHFEFLGGDFTQHFGIFPGCGKNMPFSTDSNSGGGCC